MESLSEKFKQEGRDQALEKIVLSMFRDGMPEKQILRITKISGDKLQKLVKKFQKEGKLKAPEA